MCIRDRYSSSNKKSINDDDQKGGSLSDDSSSELTSYGDDINKLYIEKNELIIKNQSSLLKKIYNKMKSLDKKNPDYELQLADLNNKYDVINNQIKYLKKINENPDSINPIDVQLIDATNKLYYLRQKIQNAEKHILELNPSSFSKLANHSIGGQMNRNIHSNLNLIQRAGFSNNPDEFNLQDILNESKNIMNFYNKLLT